MKLLIENCDFFEDSLKEVIQVLNEMLHKEDRNHEDDKRIRNILDDLDSFNISFILEDVDMVVYTMLLSMKNVSIGLIESEELSFKELVFPNEKIEREYIRLITQCNEIHGILKNKYNMNDIEIEYLDPNSKLVNLRVSLSIKDLVYFIISCGKYDETLDINLLFSEYNDLMELFVTMAMSLTDMFVVDDLFIRMKLDEENRKHILNETTENITIISNEEYINYCIQENNVEVKLSTIGACSLVGYRHIVNNIPKQDIKIENFIDFVQQEYFGIMLPQVYLEVDSDDANLIDGYIYDWYNLVNAYKEFDEHTLEEVLCCLGCFNNIFKMNTPIYNYFELDVEELTELEELMKTVQGKLLQ